MKDIFKAAKEHFDKTEVFCLTGNSVEVEFEHNTLTKIDTSENYGVALRGVKNGKLAFSTSTKPDDAQGIIDTALNVKDFSPECRFEFVGKGEMPDAPPIYSERHRRGRRRGDGRCGAEGAGPHPRLRRQHPGVRGAGHGRQRGLADKQRGVRGDVPQEQRGLRVRRAADRGAEHPLRLRRAVGPRVRFRFRGFGGEGHRGFFDSAQQRQVRRRRSAGDPDAQRGQGPAAADTGVLQRQVGRQGSLAVEGQARRRDVRQTADGLQRRVAGGCGGDGVFRRRGSGGRAGRR